MNSKMKIAYLSEFDGEELHPETTHIFGITQEALDDDVLEFTMDLKNLQEIHFAPNVKKLDLSYVGNVAPCINYPVSLQELKIDGLEERKLKYQEIFPDADLDGHTFRGKLPRLPQLQSFSCPRLADVKSHFPNLTRLTLSAIDEFDFDSYSFPESLMHIEVKAFGAWLEEEDDWCDGPKVNKMEKLFKLLNDVKSLRSVKFNGFFANDWMKYSFPKQLENLEFFCTNYCRDLRYLENLKTLKFGGMGGIEWQRVKVPVTLESLVLDSTDCDVELTNNPKCDVKWIAEDAYSSYY